MSQQSPAKGTGSDPMKFFYVILRNMTNKPDVDWNVVAAEAGYNSANTAKVRFGQIMRKLKAQDPNVPAPVPAAESFSQPATQVSSTTNSFASSNNNGNSFTHSQTGSFSSPPATPTQPKNRKQVGSGMNKSPMKVGKASQKKASTNGGSFDANTIIKRGEWEGGRAGARGEADYDWRGPRPLSDPAVIPTGNQQRKEQQQVQLPDDDEEELTRGYMIEA